MGWNWCYMWLHNLWLYSMLWVINWRNRMLKRFAMCNYCFWMFLGFGWWSAVDCEVNTEGIKVMEWERMNMSDMKMDCNAISQLFLVLVLVFRNVMKHWRAGLLIVLQRTLWKVEHACGIFSKPLTGCMPCRKINHGSMVETHRRSELDPNKCLKIYSLGLLLVFEHSSESSSDELLSVTKFGTIDAQAWPIIGGDSTDWL